MVVPEPHYDSFVPSIHHAMAVLDLRHAFLREHYLLHQPLRRLELAQFALLPLSPDGIFDASRAVRVDLRSICVEIRLFVESGSELLLVL